MNTTKYDATSKIASVSPGSHWQQVYDTLSPLGVTVAGGRAGTVGVGGFISGGGNSFYSAAHGMACDTVQNFEVVLANGSIVNANANENADLWVALKGGSGNFGLITRFDMYAIAFNDPANPVIWGGVLQYDLSAGDALRHALVEFTDNVLKDLDTSAILYWAYIPASGGWLLNVALENTAATVDPAAAAGFFKVGNITGNTLRTAELTVITQELGAGQPAGMRNIWYTLLLPNSADVMAYAQRAHEYAITQLEAVMTADSKFYTTALFQPMNSVIADVGVAKGGNVMGLNDALAGTNGIMWLITFAAIGAENQANAQPILLNYTEAIQSYAVASGASYGWHYLNYADASQDPLGVGSAGVDSVAKMKAAAAKYDPKGVFQTLRRSGFKLPSV